MSTDETGPPRVGERLSLKGQACTIRYIGSVGRKAGNWIGVEWDDPSRGKHDGAFEGTRYFECRSKSPTAGSFLKPSQSWDHPRSFLSALREKYVDSFHQNDAEVVYISGKQAEEIGFEKFAERQSQLRGIHVLVLDHMRIKHPSRLTGIDDAGTIKQMCAEITELDLSGNLFETFHEVLELCALMPKLRVLTLDGNRFANTATTHEALPTICTIRTLNISRTLLRPHEVEHVLSAFPMLRVITFAGNEIEGPLHFGLPPGITSIDLSDNQLRSLSDLHALKINCPETIILKRNKIDTVHTPNQPQFGLPVVELDLTYSAISSWTFFDFLIPHNFPKLRHLRVTGNPLYRNLSSAEGKPLTSEDGYMLTIARLPQLDHLNYAKITDKERLNAETYYLNHIGTEISRAPAGTESAIIAQHPRYRDLCNEYGEPSIQRQSRKEEIDLHSLAAKLVTFSFTLPSHVMTHVQQRNWIDEVPKAFDVYTLLGVVGKRLGILPLSLRLVLETDERDPKGRGVGYEGPEWWDSSDDEAEGVDGGDGEWVRREVEMVAGTRPIGTYVEGTVANVRVEVRDANT